MWRFVESGGGEGKVEKGRDLREKRERGREGRAILLSVSASGMTLLLWEGLVTL